jgi:hypothetical protein
MFCLRILSYKKHAAVIKLLVRVKNASNCTEVQNNHRKVLFIYPENVRMGHHGEKLLSHLNNQRKVKLPKPVFRLKQTDR